MLPKVNRFVRNLEHSKYIVGGWPWQILGTIRALATAGEPGEIFCQVSNARFHRFPIGQISRNLNTTRRSMRSCKLYEQSFENFTVKGRILPKKTKKFLLKNKRLAISGRHNSSVITDRRKLTTTIALYGMSTFHFYR